MTQSIPAPLAAAGADRSAAPRVAVLGLGEAGGRIATDLSTRVRITGYDPLWLPTLAGEAAGAVGAKATAAEAVRGAQIVLAVTVAADAPAALASVVGQVPAGTLYVDASTSSPAAKRALAQTAGEAGLRFVDAVLMAPVYQRGAATPVLAAGPAAGDLAATLGPYGMAITPVSDQPGDAAARKLLRSVLVKGLSALLIEGQRTAEQAGLGEWYWAHVEETLAEADGELARRLVIGSRDHGIRRVHEMAAAAQMVAELGEAPTMTEATRAVLDSVAVRGLPEIAADW